MVIMSLNNIKWQIAVAEMVFIFCQLWYRILYVICVTYSFQKARYLKYNIAYHSPFSSIKLLV